MAAVGLRVNTNHIGNVWAFDVGPVEHLLTEIVEFVRKDAPLDPDSVVSLLTNKSIGHFSEPPNAFLNRCLPFLCHLFLTANRDRLIT